jgi:hypothetical protein
MFVLIKQSLIKNPAQRAGGGPQARKSKMFLKIYFSIPSLMTRINDTDRYKMFVLIKQSLIKYPAQRAGGGPQARKSIFFLKIYFSNPELMTRINDADRRG